MAQSWQFPRLELWHEKKRDRREGRPPEDVVQLPQRWLEKGCDQTVSKCWGILVEELTVGR